MRSSVLDSLTLPLVQAPMAGGPVTPVLAAAVSNAGGLGSLAAGYLTATATEDLLRSYRTLSDAPVAVNVFVPEHHRAVAADLQAYRSALRSWADSQSISGEVPAVPAHNDDEFDQKIAMLCRSRPELVTFTFGLPDSVTVARLQDVGVTVGVTVTSEEEAVAAATNGADVLIAQGIEAGGHRGQFDQSAAPLDISTSDLVQRLAARTRLPIIAAGGIDGPEKAQALLDSGAIAVQIGTLFLTTEEAGTKPTHRAALLHAAADGASTVLTRVFTGRPARALANRFTAALDDRSVIGYPQVHFLTAGIRAAAAAADDAELLNLWAGTGVRGCRQESVSALLARFSSLSVRSAPPGDAARSVRAHVAEEVSR